MQAPVLVMSMSKAKALYSSILYCLSSTSVSTILTSSWQTPRVVIDKLEEKPSSQILQQPKRKLHQQPLQASKPVKGKQY
jgi:hypothetical protein